MKHIPVISLIIALTATQAVAVPMHSLGQPQQCGDYGEYDLDSHGVLMGGEGGMITFSNATPIDGLNAVAFDGKGEGEGDTWDAGKVLVISSTIIADGEEKPVSIVVTNTGTHILEPCPE